MDGPEVAWRVKSLLRDQVDSVRIAVTLIPTLKPEQIVSKANFEPGFKCSPVTFNDWQNPLSDTHRAWRDRLVKKANQILENRLTYFDLYAVHHGDPINWHRDFSAGVDAPIIQSTYIDYRDVSKFGDCKLVWEPNRHHQLVVLARAYVATNERKYALKVAELLRSWIDCNPFGYGMNWKSPLELGVRLINWVWAIDLIWSSEVFDDELWSDILQTVYRAMWDCERKFSQGSSANNHVIGEAAGVYVAACYFRQLPGANKWRKSSQDVLEREIILQTFPDGCTREHAFGYQFFVIQFFQLCLRAAETSRNQFSKEYCSRLHHMFSFLNEISADTGRPPNMGDSDNGYVLDLGELPRNTSELLSVGAHQFNDHALMSSGQSETVFWLFGGVRQPATGLEGSRPSVLFTHSGYAILRSSRVSAFVDCADLGYGPIAAHGHADCLSLCLNVDGYPVLIDSGTYDYFTYPDWRTYFRETKAHNTAEIDGISQSQSLGPFMWGQRAKASLLEWTDDDSSAYLVAQHDGYQRLKDPVNHRRAVRLDKNANVITVTDIFESKQAHSAALYFHFDPSCQLQYIDDQSLEIICPFGTLQVTTQRGKMRRLVSKNSLGPGWVSGGYHEKKPTLCIVNRFQVSGTTRNTCTFSIL